MRVLVLAGGPDAERAVSLASAKAVAAALRERYAVEYHEIDRPDAASLAALPGDVVFPVLHGRWGEGGPLQDLLEADGRPYVGSGPRAARLAMDKLASKLAAARCGVTTAAAGVLNADDPTPPIDLPVVIKPVFEGSSVGLHICRDLDGWDAAVRAVRADGRTDVYMVERFVAGREVTQPLVEIEGVLTAMPAVEIVPAAGSYDYAAKYERTDTRYVVGPELPPGVAERMASASLAIARAMGVRHLARVDFILPAGIGGCEPSFLEINTMPGFTATSLLPKAAATRGLDMPGLCALLVEAAATNNAPEVA